MLPLDRLPANPTLSPLRNAVLREFILRQDRIPNDQRVDIPEIQESFRVSFSQGALAAAAEENRNVLQKPGPSDEGGAAELKLRAYVTIARM